MRAAIVLAGGRSERFGRADKLFADFRGQSLVLHAIRAARAAPAARVIVAAGRGAGRLRGLIRRHGLRGVTVVRVKAGAPMSASLDAAIAALRPIERDAFVFLGDMPLVDPLMASRLVRALRPGIALIRPRWWGEPGHPVLARNIRAVPRRSGDAGFRPAAGCVATVAGRSGCVLDIDSPAALARARRHRHGQTGIAPAKPRSY